MQMTEKRFSGETMALRIKRDPSAVDLEHGVATGFIRGVKSPVPVGTIRIGRDTPSIGNTFQDVFHQVGEALRTVEKKPDMVEDKVFRYGGKVALVQAAKAFETHHLPLQVDAVAALAVVLIDREPDAFRSLGHAPSFYADQMAGFRPATEAEIDAVMAGAEVVTTGDRL